MNYYAIGIGGTGAKCVEALIHLCAAGMMPDGELYTLFVDADTANGNLERTRITINQYINCKQLGIGKSDLFKTPISQANPDVWSPVTIDGGSRRNLDDIFGYSILQGRSETSGLADLFDVLYSPEEKNITLEKGFRGHPSIGAAVMSNAMELGEAEPWKTFRDKVKGDIGAGQKVKIFIFGSIFGGTGAAGFPTIARLIRDELSQFTPKESGLTNIGGALMLPYFSFVPSGEDKELRASSEDFLLNTQAALKYYYHLQENEKVFDGLYLIGDENLNPTKTFSIGAKTQQNDPHFIEIYAALAAIDFYKNEVSEYRMVARQSADKLEWSDMPDGNKGNLIRQKTRQLTRFAVAYLNVYLPMLESIRLQRGTYRAPWYIDYFERNHKSVDEDDIQECLKQIKDYCIGFLEWEKKIHTFSQNNDPAIQLVNWNALEGRAAVSQFTNLVYPAEANDRKDLDKVWAKLCSNRINDSTATVFGQFIQALYLACA